MPRNQIHKETAEPQGEAKQNGASWRELEPQWEELQTVEHDRPESDHQKGVNQTLQSPQEGERWAQSHSVEPKRVKRRAKEQ